MVGALVYFVLVIRWRALSQEELKGMPKGHMLLAMARRLRILREDAEKGGASKGNSGKKARSGKNGAKARKSSSSQKSGKEPSSGQKKAEAKGKAGAIGTAAGEKKLREQEPLMQTRRLYQDQIDEDDDDFWLDD